MIRELHSPVGSRRRIEDSFKADALLAVLQSATFSRAEQLRNFLRYICEMEMAGKSSAITEYSIGVEALGRGAEFVPADDGVVRNRAHVLRQKLLEYYTQENPAAPLRIELAKGSYIPRFSPAEPLPAVRRVASHRWRDALGGFLAAMAVCAIGLLVWRWTRPAADAVIQEAWGPLAEAGANSLVVMGTPTQFVIRPYPVGAHPRNVLDLPLSPEAAAFFEARSPQLAGKQLHMRSATAHRVGEVLGAVAMLRTMESFGASYQVMPDLAIQPASLRGRNVLLFGDPVLSPKVANYLERGAFAIEYDPAAGDFAIREKTGGASAEKLFYTKSARVGTLLDVPGLLTVMPSVDAPDGKKRSVILACSDSAGCQTAAEFFCSPKSLRDLQQRFRKEGLGFFPRAYQVIVMGRTDGNSVLSFQYVTHRVLDRSAP